MPIRPSRRSSQLTCEPSPGTTPKARTSKTPPSDSLRLRSTLISSTIAFEASASRQRTGDASTSAKSAGREAVRLGRLHRADLRHVREDLHAERGQEALGQRPAGHARGRLARAGALEHVAHVGEAELLHAREVGVTGPREVHLGHLGLDRPRVHPLLPVGVVAVGDPHGDRAAERAAVADPGGDLGAVALDLHAPAAAVAELAARHVAVDRGQVELEARGQALDDAGQAGPVGLPGGDDAQRHADQKAIRRGSPGAAADGTYPYRTSESPARLMSTRSSWKVARTSGSVSSSVSSSVAPPRRRSPG